MIYNITYNMIEDDDNLPEYLAYTSLSNDSIVQCFLQSSNENKNYFLEFDVISEVNTGGQIYWGKEDGSWENSITYKVTKGEKHYSFDLTSKSSIRYIRLAVGDIEGKYELKNIKTACYILLSKIEQKKYIESLGKSTGRREASENHMRKHRIFSNFHLCRIT